ncbi:transposase [Fimbriiglobus ruber]|uniref:Transposase n=1 Tax=Fimbriiglobus ruber TaxID=1908690 RepID=A0A225DEA5_9BACT|nr:transposase [Fimbriiglobus ruber]OWK39333.1 transposase [Fimbriiglobus ruber]
MIHRRRYQRTCDGPGPLTRTAPPPAKLIPKSRFGTSVWVDVLLDKFASHRPTERLLQAWGLLDFDVAAGTIADGLHRLQPLFHGLYDALRERNGLSTRVQADETRWKVFEVCEGKTGHVWWLWVFLGADTTVYILDVSRSRNAPAAHLGGAEGVLVVAVLGRQSSAWGEGRPLGTGLLLGSCAPGFYPGGQGVAGPEGMGFGRGCVVFAPCMVPIGNAWRPRPTRTGNWPCATPSPRCGGNAWTNSPIPPSVHRSAKS